MLLAELHSDSIRAVDTGGCWPAKCYRALSAVAFFLAAFSILLSAYILIAVSTVDPNRKHKVKDKFVSRLGLLIGVGLYFLLLSVNTMLFAIALVPLSAGYGVKEAYDTFVPGAPAPAPLVGTPIVLINDNVGHGLPLAAPGAPAPAPPVGTHGFSSNTNVDYWEPLSIFLLAVASIYALLMFISLYMRFALFGTGKACCLLCHGAVMVVRTASLTQLVCKQGRARFPGMKRFTSKMQAKKVQMELLKMLLLLLLMTPRPPLLAMSRPPPPLLPLPLRAAHESQSRLHLRHNRCKE